MPDTAYLFAALGVSAAVTWGLRALPFTAVSRLRRSRIVHDLGTQMPTGVMIILLAYCLRDLPLTDPGLLPAPLTALIVTGGLHLWRRNALLSSVAGTTTYVVLANAALT